MLHRTVSPIFSMLMTVLLLFSGSSFLFILIAINGTINGYSRTEIASITSSYYIGQLFGTFLVQWTIKRTGYIRTFSIFVIIFGMAALLLSNIQIISWIILRFIAGFSMASIVIVVETWINDKASNANRGKLFSIYMFIYYLAFGGGQFLINIPFHHNESYFILANLLICAAIIPICLTRFPEPKYHNIPGTLPPMMRFFKKAPLGLIGICVSGISNASFYGMSAILGKDIGLSLNKISLLTGITILSGFLFQWPIGALSDRIGRRLIMMIISIFIICSAFFLLIIEKKYLLSWLIFPLSIWYGASVFAFYSICNSYTNDLVSPHERLNASRVIIMLFAISSSVGPIIVGYAMTFDAVLGFYGTIITFHILMILLNLIRQITHPLPDTKKVSRIILFPHTFSPVISTMVNRWRNKKNITIKNKKDSSS